MRRFGIIFFILIFAQSALAGEPNNIHITTGEDTFTISWQSNSPSGTIFDVNVALQEAPIFIEQYQTSQTTYILNDRTPNTQYCIQIVANEPDGSVYYSDMAEGCGYTLSKAPIGINLDPNPLISVNCDNFILTGDISCTTPQQLISYILSLDPDDVSVEKENVPTGGSCGVYPQSNTRVKVRSCASVTDVCDMRFGTTGVCVSQSQFTSDLTNFRCGYGTCSTAYDLTLMNTYTARCSNTAYYKVSTTSTCDITWIMAQNPIRAVNPDNQRFLYYIQEKNKCYSFGRKLCTQGTGNIKMCTILNAPAGTYYSQVSGTSSLGSFDPYTISVVKNCQV